MSPKTNIAVADIKWTQDKQDNLVPTSCRFDDVYFSHAGGLLESDYVFLQHNQLAARFDKLWQTGGLFVIAETGFGTGLNFLATLCLWFATKQRHNTKHRKQPNQHATPRLHFISTEKYPLKRDDLVQALGIWQNDHLYGQALKPLIDKLVSLYPLAIDGCHRRMFDDVILDIWLGDATDSLCQLVHQHSSSTTGNIKSNTPTANAPKVDAWFLDGFSPKKNAHMWSDKLFECIGKLSHNGTTLATFTAAGDIKRKLIHIGATPIKVTGFGHKRHMLTAHFEHLASHNPKTPQKIIVLGAGIAGLCCAYALAKRGLNVQLIDKNHPLAGASGNHRAMLSPKLSQHNDNLSLWGFLYAQHFYTQFDRVFYQTGVVDFLLPNKKSDDKCQQLMDCYPDEIIYKTDNPPNSKQHFSAFLPMAGLIDPHALAKAILSHPNICYQQQTVHFNADCGHFVDKNQRLFASYNTPVVICAGFESADVHQRIFCGRKIRGQVSYILSNNPSFEPLKASLPQAVKYDGYACISDEMITLGASFVRNSTDCAVYDDEHRYNIAKLYAHFDQLPSIDSQLLSGRASIRLQTPDYHPIVGKLTDNTYTLTALGSKGFCLAPLCAEIIASLILQECLPISWALWQKIQPNRPRLQTPLRD